MGRLVSEAAKSVFETVYVYTVYVIYDCKRDKTFKIQKCRSKDLEDLEETTAKKK